MLNFPYDWLIAQPIHALELLFGELLEGRHLHVNRRLLELNVQLLPAVTTPNGCDHLCPFMVVGADGEMSWRASAHGFAVTPPTVAGHPDQHIPRMGDFDEALPQQETLPR